MQVAACQMEVGPEVDRNLATARDLVARAAAAGAELVLLPEACVVPIDASAEALAAAATSLDGDIARRFAALAAEHQTTVVAGLVEPHGDGKVLNTVAAFGPEGDVLGAYRKIHLYDAFGMRESDRFAPGALEPLLFDAAGFRVGVMTCYDLRFPELARLLVDRGAELLLVPAAWVQGALKELHWSTLLRARAIENTVFVAAAGQCGAAYCGNSVVLDPLGVGLAALGEAPGVAVATLDRARLEDVRGRLPVLTNRRLRQPGL